MAGSTLARRRSLCPAARLARHSFVLAVLTSLACNNDSLTFPYCPPSALGTLEGYVLAAGEGFEARITAEPSRNVGPVTFSTRSSSTGWYRLEMPTGTYRINIDTEDVTIDAAFADTVRVAAETRRLDLHYGKVTILVRAAAILAGRSFRCRLNRVRGSDEPRAVATVRDGFLEFVFPVVKAGEYWVGI